MKNKAAQIGLVVGIVFIIMGLAYGAMQVYGCLVSIFLAIGIVSRLKKPSSIPDKSDPAS